MNTAKKINPEGFEELVRELARHDDANGHQFGAVVRPLQEVAESLQQFAEAKTEKECEAIMERIQRLQAEIRQGFQQFILKNGTSMEDAYRFMENPKNFNQKQWEEIQAIRRNVEEKAIVSLPVTSKKKERRKGQE